MLLSLYSNVIPVPQVGRKHSEEAVCLYQAARLSIEQLLGQHAW